MENVHNVQRDGFSMQMKFVLQSVIYVIPGLKMENVKAVIKAILFNKENVLEILMNLYQVQIVFVHNGKKENA